MNTRRTFVMGAGAVVASHLPAARAMSANDKVRVAVLGELLRALQESAPVDVAVHVKVE